MLNGLLLLTALAQPPQAPAPAEAERLAREARTRFGVAVLEQRQDRLLEAVGLFEEAARLDPAAAAPRRALVPLYLTLGRTEDAVAAARQVLQRSPGDADTWNVLAEVLRDQGKPGEASDALRRAADAPAAADRPAVLLEWLGKLGRWREEARDWTGAEAAYRRAAGLTQDRRDRLVREGTFSPADLASEAASAWEGVGRACLGGGHFAEAAEAFRRAGAADPVRARRLDWNLAQVSAAQGRPDEALAALDRYLEGRPPNPAAYELKVRLLRETGHPEAIAPALRRYAEREPQFLALRLTLARELGLAGEPDAAQAEFRALAALAPTAEVYRGWFQALERQREPGKVLELLDEALKQSAADGQTESERGAAAERARAMLSALRGEPGLVRALLPIALARPAGGERAAGTLRALAELAARTNQLDAAERLYRLALRQIAPGNFQQQGDVYAGLLPVLWRARRFEAVRDVAREGMALPPRVQPAPRLLRYYLALALDALGEPDEALRVIDQALRLPGGGDQLVFRLQKVQVLRRAGRLDAAEAACAALLKEHRQPHQVRDVRLELAQVYEARHDFARAEEELQLVLAADPNDATALNSLGYQWADRGCRLEEAERLIRKAIDLDRGQRRTLADPEPDSGAYLDSLGWVLFRRGQLDEGRRWLEQAAALPDGSADPTVWDHLGDVYSRLGDAAKARSAWQTARRLYAAERRQANDDHPAEVERKLKTVPGP
jgi:tetratricopeptide (TPR) repeat protein